MKRAFGSRKGYCALRFMAATPPFHRSRKASTSYSRSECFINTPPISHKRLAISTILCYTNPRKAVEIVPRCKEYQSKYPDNAPEWYWKSGLHDAAITDVESFEFPFDYNKFVGEKSKYNRNLFVLKIDAKGALFDSTVKEIRLFNYKIISDSINLDGRKKVWWLSDRLTEENGDYFLEIDLQDFDSFPQEFTFRIKFARAEVDRS